MPKIIINDGRLLSANLKSTGHGMTWLEGELKKKKVPGIYDVFIMTVDENSGIYLERKEK